MLKNMPRCGVFESGFVKRQLVSVAITLLYALQSWSTPLQAPTQNSQQQPTATFQSNSELVLVPVVVTDSKGKHVTDLSADDFTISENSQPHIIKHFDRIQGAPAPASRPVDSGFYTNASAPGEKPASITIILLDSVNTSALDQKNAIEQISK